MTALGTRASSMAARSWSEIQPSGLQETLGIGSQKADGSASTVAGSGVKFTFSNSMPWDPLGKKAVFVGADHSDARGVHADYADATNAWSVVATGLYSHGFQHLAINPSTGDRYLWRTGDLCKGQSDGQFTSLGPFPYGQVSTVSAALAWWDGPFAGAGAQGALINFCGLVQSLSAWDPLTGKHFYQVAPASDEQGNLYHVVSAYGRKKNCLVYGLGNNASGYMAKKLWRLNADGTRTKMPDAPHAGGIYHGMNLVADPASGNFLAYGFGEFWELNPDGAGTWARINVNMPMLEPAYQAGGGGNSLVACSCETYGVILYVDARYNRSPKCKMYIYKHA